MENCIGTYACAALPARRRLFIRLVNAAGCICACLLTPVGVCDEPADEAIDPVRFLAVYRRAVHELRATYSNVRIYGTVRIVQTAAPPREPSTPEQSAKAPGRPRFAGSDRRFEFSYASSDGKEKGRRAPFGGADPGREGVAVDNGNIQFAVGRTGPGRPYSVGHQSKDDGDLRPLAELRLQVRDSPYRPNGFADFEKFIDSPDFSIERARRVRGAGGSIVSLLVHFRYRPPAEVERHIDGRLDLDESLGLVIRHYELEYWRELPDGGRNASGDEGTVQYKQENGKAVPTHVDFRIHPIPETGRSTRWEYDISRYSLESTPPEEFTLAHYGLGDFEHTLDQVEKRSAYRTVAVAGAAFLIGVALLWIARMVYKGRAGSKSLPARPCP